MNRALLAVLVAFPCLAGAQESGVVANRLADGWSSGQAWRLEEDLRLGTVVGGGPTEFGEISSLAVDDQGRIYVADFQAQEVRVFLASGEYSHTVGRAGYGPGEFGRIRGLAISGDGSLWVLDVDPSRLSVFEPDGSFRSSYPRGVRGSIIPWPGRFIDEDRLLDWGLEVARVAPSRRGTGVTLVPTLFDPPDSLQAFPPIRVRLGGTARGEAQVHNRSSTQVVSKDGSIWFAYTDEYVVRHRSLMGDTLLSFSLDVEPLRQNVDSIVQAYRDAGRRIESSDVFPYARLITRVLTDDNGHVYVFLGSESVESGGAADVYRQDGRYLGRVRFPHAIETVLPSPVVTASHLYGVVRDEFDVPYVVRWRIIRP